MLEELQRGKYEIQRNSTQKRAKRFPGISWRSQNDTYVPDVEIKVPSQSLLK